jgi:hypothetical protein
VWLVIKQQQVIVSIDEIGRGENEIFHWLTGRQCANTACKRYSYNDIGSCFVCILNCADAGDGVL